MRIRNGLAPRFCTQIDVAGDSPVADYPCCFVRSVRSHENAVAGSGCDSGYQNHQFMLFSRNNGFRYIQPAAGEKHVTGFLAVNEDASACLEHRDFQLDFFAVPAAGNFHCAPIPRGSERRWIQSGKPFRIQSIKGGTVFRFPIPGHIPGTLKNPHPELRGGIILPVSGVVTGKKFHNPFKETIALVGVVSCHASSRHQFSSIVQPLGG